MKFNYRSLSVRAYLLILVLSVILPSVGVFAWHVAQEQQAALKGAADRLKDLADQAAGELGDLIRDNERVLGRLAARPQVRALDAKKCDPILPDYVSLHPEFSTLAIRDVHANIVCTLLNNPPTAEQIRQTAWFQDATRSGKFTLGDATQNLRTNRWVSISAFPVLDSRERLSGFVFFSMDLLKLGQQLFRAVPRNILIDVVDRQGNFLLRSGGPGNWLGHAVAPGDAAAIKGQREGFFASSGVDGVLSQVAFAAVPDTEWHVLARLPEAEIFAATRARLFGSIVVGIAVLGLVLALAFWIGTAIVNPVIQLAGAAERIALGDSHTRAPVTGPVEVAAVAQQFNHMLNVRERAEVARASLEEQLRESQKMQAIGTLAGGIAHDFNNIIATILGNVELARQDAQANPLALQSIEEIEKAGGRARDLVRQILSFSRRQPTERKPTALGPVVKESARLLQSALPARVVLEVQCGTDVPAVLADVTQIEQVLINLATNAMQAMAGAPGRIVIRLDTVMLDQPQAGSGAGLPGSSGRAAAPTVRLSVSDDGPGMDAATADRIFEPFFTTKPVNEGTGLGLSVVHGIAQSHDGSIEVDTAPGKGATFTLYLPAAKAEEIRFGIPERQQRELAAVGDPAAAPRSATGVRILCIDDDESLVLLVKRMLERRGFQVSGYTDQGEALAALRADPDSIDLVVSDYNMPGMSGLDVAREVHAIRADLPVAIASGFIDEALSTQASGAGVRELIFKADAAEDLCDAFERLASAIGRKM